MYPYNGMGNNPISMVDPNGGRVKIYGQSGRTYDQAAFNKMRQDAYYYNNYMSFMSAIGGMDAISKGTIYENMFLSGMGASIFGEYSNNIIEAYDDFNTSYEGHIYQGFTSPEDIIDKPFDIDGYHAEQNEMLSNYYEAQSSMANKMFLAEKNYYMEVSERWTGNEMMSQWVNKLVLGDDTYEFSQADGVSIEEARNFGMMVIVNQMMGGMNVQDFSKKTHRSDVEFPGFDAGNVYMLRIKVNNTTEIDFDALDHPDKVEILNSRGKELHSEGDVKNTKLIRFGVLIEKGIVRNNSVIILKVTGGSISPTQFEFDVINGIEIGQPYVPTSPKFIENSFSNPRLLEQYEDDGG